ncbi:MAG TPA: serine hydrolase [Steroidobacteraceae bacterium]|nr:serine hydrolase [Steroidobacteraceae bacterium]
MNPLRHPVSLLCCLLAAAGAAHAATPRQKFSDVRSSAVLILDRASDSVVYARHETQAAPIASITKLLTALVVLEAQQPLDEQIQITAEDRSRTGGAASRLAVGTRLTRRELLRLALMSSENRAAQALCRSYTGGEDACLAAMNAKAAQIGMTQAHFEDPTGLSSRNVASPNDLARLVVAADRNPLIREFSTTPEYTARIRGQQVEFHNTDPLVRDPAWQVSVQKTGHIAAAGECLVLQALINGRDMVIVLLNSVGKYTRVADARRIQKWLATAEEAVSRVAAGTPRR